MPKIRITDIVLQSLKAERRTDFWDAALPAFGVRVGSKTKTFIIKRNNRRIAVGRYPSVSLSEARTRAKALLYDSTYSPTSQLSLENAIARFMDTHCKDYRPRTRYETERLLKKLSALNKKKLSRITTHDIHEIVDALPRSEANHLFKVCRTFFRWAHRRRYITHSPLAGLAIPNGERSRARVLSDDEVKCIWQACDQNTVLSRIFAEPDFISRGVGKLTNERCALPTSSCEQTGERRDKRISMDVSAESVPRLPTNFATVLEQTGDRTVWQGVERHGGLRDVPECLDERDVHKIPALPRLPKSFCAIVKLLILTGMRRSECAALQTSWIQNDLINLPAEICKNNRPHAIPIGKKASIILLPLLASTKSSQLLFPARKTGTPSPFNGWSKSKKLLDQKAGVRDWTLHDFRRYHSSTMARLGVRQEVEEKLLNHVSGKVSGVAAVYNRYDYMDEMREAVDKYEAHLRRILELP